MALGSYFFYKSSWHIYLCTSKHIQSDGYFTFSVYHYQFSGNEITLEYPNQATYSQTDYGGSIASGWTENYDDARYVPGDVLIGVLYADSPPSRRTGNPLIGLLFLAVGLWNAISPYSSWYLSHGWRYKNAEPSDLALGLTRAGGIFAILLGILAFFV